MAEKRLTNRSSLSILSIPSLLGLSLLSGCCTTYYHDKVHSDETMMTEKPMTHKAIQHDGLVLYLQSNPGVEVETACGKNGWETIKMETNLADVVIRAIANPIWGTQTVQYRCKDSAIAQTDPTGQINSADQYQ